MNLLKLISLTSLFILSMPLFADRDLKPLKFCGNIYREQTSSSHSSSREVKLKKVSATGEIIHEFIIFPANKEVAQVLALIKWPNDSYIGCVLSNEYPEQGFEGEVLEAYAIELQGQL